MSNMTKLWTAIGAMVACLLVAGSVEHNGLFSEITAAWIQAVGSIAAVIGAAWIATASVREQRRSDALKEERRQSEALVEQKEARTRAGMLIGIAADSLESLIRLVRESPESEINTYILLSFSAAVDRIVEFDHCKLTPQSATEQYARSELRMRATLEYLNRKKAHTDKMEGEDRINAHNNFLEIIEDVPQDFADDKEEILSANN